MTALVVTILEENVQLYDSGTYRNCTILVRSRIATYDKQFWDVPELHSSGAYQN